MTSKYINRIIDFHMKHWENIQGASLLVGASVGLGTSIYSACEEKPPSFVRTFGYSILGTGFGTFAGCALPYTYPLAFISGIAYFYQIYKEPVKKLK